MGGRKEQRKEIPVEERREPKERRKGKTRTQAKKKG